MSGKLLTNFKYLKGFITFHLILDQKAAYLKISKESRVAIASVVRLVNLSSNFHIIILRFKSP